MKSTKPIPQTVIETKIFLLRGKKVMLDFQIAQLYEIETRALNQAVRRNRERFPSDFMFALTRLEIRNISQIVTCSGQKHSKNIFAFTEQGVAMFSSVLHSRRAIQVKIAIMRTFVRIKTAIASNKRFAQQLKKLEQRISEHDISIRSFFSAIRELLREKKERAKPRRLIGFHGGVER